MPRLVRKPPSYSLHKPSGQARVRLAGREYWLGSYGSPESHAEYDRLVGEWLAGGRRAPTPKPPAPPPGSVESLTIAELILAYWRYVQSYYVKHGKPTSEPDNVRQALRPLRELYGHTLARDFGPLSLKSLRQSMIERGWSRGFINQQVGRIRAMFRWAASEELLPTSNLEALRTVAGLRAGRSEAREKPPVGPVADEVLEKSLPHLPPVVAAMVQVQRLAGMRPQEVIEMRGADLDRSDPECWAYRPARHKGQHHGRQRVIYLGPRAQAIIARYLEEAGDGYLFSPRRSEEARNAAKRAGRVTPRWPSHCKRSRKTNPKRAPGECYSRHSYRWAIRRACDRAGVPPWHPHMIRHASATEIRKRFGLEASQAVLGHAELGVTQIYAEKDLDRARAVMRELG